MIKIKNKILIYFTFYIKNISFLKNEKVHNQVSKNEKDEQIHNEKRILKFKFSDYKNDWLTIIIGFSGVGFLFILLFNIYKILNILSKYKADTQIEAVEQEKLELIKDFIQKDINNLDFFITNDDDIFFKIKKNQDFLNYFNANFFDFDVISDFIFKSVNLVSLISDKLDFIKNEINNLKNNQKKSIIIKSNYRTINNYLSKLNFLKREKMTNIININTNIYIDYIDLNIKNIKIQNKRKQILDEILDKYCELKTN